MRRVIMILALVLACGAGAAAQCLNTPYGSGAAVCIQHVSLACFGCNNGGGSPPSCPSCTQFPSNVGAHHTIIISYVTFDPGASCTAPLGPVNPPYDNLVVVGFWPPEAEMVPAPNPTRTTGACSVLGGSHLSLGMYCIETGTTSGVMGLKGTDQPPNSGLYYWAEEWSGLDLTEGVNHSCAGEDGFSANAGTAGTSYGTGNITTTGPHDMIFASAWVYSAATAGLTVTAPYTQVSNYVCGTNAGGANDCANQVAHITAVYGAVGPGTYSTTFTGASGSPNNWLVSQFAIGVTTGRNRVHSQIIKYHPRIPWNRPRKVIELETI